jgi:hypothetical protein
MDLIATWNAKQPVRLDGDCGRREGQVSILARGFQTNSYFAHNLPEFNFWAIE